jgi:DNA-binding IclR family transcriptional regulator
MFAFMNREKGAVKSAARVLDLLEMLASAPEKMGVSDIARSLGIPKSSAHMLLSTLQERHYVLCDEARRFRLNPMFGAGQRAWVGGSRAALIQIAPTAMMRLVEATQETSLLGVPRDDRTLEYIHKVLSPQEVRCDVTLNQPRPMHSLSLGLVLLAFQAQARTQAFLKRGKLDRLTPETTCEPARLRREIAVVRDQGYAVTRDTNTAGVSGISAPVFDGEGRVVAALSISVPTSRFEALVRRATGEVVRTARSMSDELSMMERRAAA